MKAMIIDGKNLAMSALHSTGIDINENRTGIIYSFLEKLLKYQSIIKADKFLFCWDSVYYFRKDILPTYKKRDVEYNKEEINQYEEALRQIEILKTDVLPRLGFTNVYEQYGMEADDLIAKYCKTAPKDEEIIILSSDKDLHQLMEDDSNRIRCYSIAAKKFYTSANLKDKLGITTAQWGEVKAIAGCRSDKVNGINGVADKRAAAFLRKDLTSGKFYDRIVSEDGQKTIEFNKRLVILPFSEKRVIDLRCEKNDLYKKDFVEFFHDYKYYWWLNKKRLSNWFKTFNLK